MSKTSPRGKKDLEPRTKLRLIKGGLWGTNPKAPDDRDKRRVRNLAVMRTSGANVQGGKSPSPLLTKACATSQHHPTVVITT
jgi:hypothetical protein